MVLGLVISLIGGAFLFMQGFQPSSVVVSGSAATPGFGSDAFQYSVYGTTISFTSKTGQVYNATVTEGRYSLTLPNDQTYYVQISALGEPNLTCNAGSFIIRQGPGSGGLTENWSC